MATPEFRIHSLFVALTAAGRARAACLREGLVEEPEDRRLGIWAAAALGMPPEPQELPHEAKIRRELFTAAAVFGDCDVLSLPNVINSLSMVALERAAKAAVEAGGGPQEICDLIIAEAADAFEGALKKLAVRAAARAIQGLAGAADSSRYDLSPDKIIGAIWEATRARGMPWE